MEDIGLIAGTGIFMLFGLFFSVLMPKLMKRNGEESEDALRLASWLRWLGIILVVLSLAAAIAIYLLPKDLPY